MKTQELKSKGEAELRAELAKLRKEAQEVTGKMRLGQVKNVRQVRAMRKDIARILTLLKIQSWVMRSEAWAKYLKLKSQASLLISN